MLFLFDEFVLDTDRRELRGAKGLIAVEPQVFDLLTYLVRNRDRVVSKDDILATVWDGRLVSDSAMTTRINAARRAIGDSGEAQRFIKTLPRIGMRFVGAVCEEHGPWAMTQPPPFEWSILPALPDRPSIAVLPFANMSGDPEQQYFSDGITEDIITELSRFRSLFVIARQSSFAFKGRLIKVQEIARELGVAFIVEGSVRRAGDSVRINVQLVDASSGNQLWAERYDRDLLDIFALQDDVARSVAATISGRVDAAGRDRVERLSPTALRAYDLVLRAKALTSNYTRSDNAQALSCAERAVQLDPASARAHTHSAWCHFYDYMAFWTADHRTSLARSFERAQRAVALDETDSFARSMLGIVHWFRREFDQAQSEILAGVAQNPNDFLARRYYGLFLAATGNPEKGIEQIELGQRLNPFDTRWVPWNMGIVYFTARRYDDAIAALKRARNPINEVRGWLVASYAHAGRIAEAKAALDEFLQLAEADMADFPGPRLGDWQAYWHAAFEYQDQRDFDHLFDALRKAGLPD